LSRSVVEAYGGLAHLRLSAGWFISDRSRKRAATSGAVVSIVGLILVPLPGPGIALMMTGVGLLLVALLPFCSDASAASTAGTKRWRDHKEACSR
jgi:hypothetical protein